MYSAPHHPSMLPPQQRPVAPETFLLDQDAQQSLPADSVVALQQVDNREFHQLIACFCDGSKHPASPLDQLLTIANSEILSHLCPGRLGTGPVHSEIPSAYWRICFLYPLVSSSQPLFHFQPPLTTSRSNLFHISGTDIVRCLAFRFQAFGRPVKNSKKFEEGIFSDLRNLKSGTDASLE